MSFVSRRQFLLGASAAATLAAAPALLKEEPQAQALQPVKKKYNYSLNPLTNRYRFGILTLPRSLSPSIPVVVLVHGGSWTTNGDVYSVAHLARELAENGVAVWNIEYRSLGTGGGWPTTYADVCDAIDHLLVLKIFHAINLDLDRIYLAGHSAGSQLAALALGQSPRRVSLSKLVGNTDFFRSTSTKEVALKNLRGDNIAGHDTSSLLSARGSHSHSAHPHTSPQYGVVGTGDMANRHTKAPAGPSLPIRGFISLNGVLDVVDSANRSQRSSIATFLGGTPKEVPGNYYAANPFTHLPSGKHISVVQGGRDTVIPHGQARKYVAAARRRGNVTHFHWVHTARHNDFLYPHRNPKAFNFGAATILRTMGLPYKPWANREKKKLFGNLN